MAESISRSAPLPSLSYLDMEKIQKDPAYTYTAHSTTNSIVMAAPPLASPSTTTYSGPPPPYSYPSSAASSSVGTNAASAPGQISNNYPPQLQQARQSNGNEKEAIPPAPRHSLPSIHEALSITSLINTAAPPRTSAIAQTPLSAPPASQPDSTFGPSHNNGIIANPNHVSPTDARHYDTATRPAPAAYGPRVIGPPPPSLHQSPGHTSSFHTHQLSSPTHSRPGPSTMQQDRRSLSPLHHPHHSYQHPHQSQQQPGGHPADAPTAGPEVRSPYQVGYSYPNSAVGGHHLHGPPPSQQQPWRSGSSDYDRAEEIRKATQRESPNGRPAYGESVKRHLDIFDLETSLNEIAEGGGQTLEYARHHGINAHQHQRSGPTSASYPSLVETDNMIGQARQVVDALLRIREVILKQQQALAEQRSYDLQSQKAVTNDVEDDARAYAESMDGAGGFAGADAKKRRGRAAPPGRCHSCNRAETPEWRRGPDGARTLCNACGLHYAKLTRKMGGSNKNAAGSSSLRPKESAPSSPNLT